MKIKNYLALFSLVLLGAMIIITSCEKESDYNFNNIDPGKTAINGPDAIYTVGEYTFKALTRGGSTYSWEKISGDFDFSADGHVAVVSSSASVDGEGVLKCTETTQGGKTGIPDTITFDINVFCTFDINTFVGEYSCDEAGYGVYPCNLSIDPDNENAILNDNFWDWPAEGETLRYEFSGDFDQIVTIPEQDFIFGDGSEGTVVGSGTYNGCTGEMTVEYDVIIGEDVYPTLHVFTPGAPAARSVRIQKGK